MGASKLCGDDQVPFPGSPAQGSVYSRWWLVFSSSPAAVAIPSAKVTRLNRPLASDSTMADSIREGSSIQEQVITTANVFVEVKSLDAAVNEVVDLTQAADGTIDAQSIYRQNGSASAMMTVRVPSDGLTSFLADIEELGTVRSTDINSQDVTLEVIDIQARITTLEGSINRLRELQQQATSVSDLVAVEAELANRQSELESLTARRDYLANQVELSTAYLTLSEEETGPATSPDFLGGLQRGWDALLTLGAGVVTGVGFLLPIAAVVACPSSSYLELFVSVARGGIKDHECALEKNCRNGDCRSIDMGTFSLRRQRINIVRARKHPE